MKVISHVGIGVRDMERSLRFRHQQFLTILTRDPDGNLVQFEGFA
jgi:catechol 2,3-dioxygenase-like lactoylglutathione lyase family enzyme